jgi:protein ImuB
MFASIFISHFPVQSLIRSEPELLGQPVAVVDGTPPLLKVVSANKKAAEAGIEWGMAKLKVEHFFNVAIRPRSPVQESSAHAALLDCANAFSPRVEDTADDTVVIDLEGLDRLFGSQHEIAAQIFDQTLLVGLQPNVTVAANPDAAICASRGFEGLLVIPQGEEQKRLADLPLEVLRPDPEFIETLHRWGIRSFGAFAALPAKKISERLGQHGVYLQQLARGTASRPLNPYKDALRFEEVMELDHEIVLLEPLTFVISRLLDQICRRLRIRNRATHEVHVRLEPPHHRVLRLPLPVCDPQLLLKLLMLDLESHPPNEGVTKVTVEAIPTRPRTVQNGLFVPLAPEPEKLELTLARIAHIVGKENVGSPQISDTHRPDSFLNKHFSIAPEGRQSVAPGVSPGLKPKAIQPRRGVRGGEESFAPPGLNIREIRTPGSRPGLRSAAPPGLLPGLLAFRLFRPPLEASVQLRDGIPNWIAFHGMFGAITSASGPWNSSGDWWREDRWDREEWDVGIESRAKGFGMYRIYRDVASGQWFAEGVYD